MAVPAVPLTTGLLCKRLFVKNLDPKCLGKVKWAWINLSTIYLLDLNNCFIAEEVWIIRYSAILWVYTYVHCRQRQYTRHNFDGKL